MADITSNLIRYYSLDGDFIEATGSGANGTPINSPTFGTGRLGQAINFAAGSSQYVTFASLTLGDFAFALWARCGAWTNRGTLIATDNFPTTPRNAAIISRTGTSDATNLLFSSFANNTGGELSVPVTVGDWNHLALVRSGTTVTAYVNGVAHGTTITVGSGTFNFFNGRLGGHHFSGSTARFANAEIDEVRIYDAAKSADDIRAMMDFRRMPLYSLCV